MRAAVADGCISAEIGNFLFFRTAHFCRSRTRQTQLVWMSLKIKKLSSFGSIHTKVILDLEIFHFDHIFVHFDPKNVQV